MNQSNYRSIYEKIITAVGIPFYALFLIAIKFQWVPLTENLFIRYLLLGSVPLVLTSLYLTSYKKVFPQRIGDCFQIILSILFISAGGTYFVERMSLSGPLFIFFVLLIPLYILLLDSFLPLFIGGSLSLLLIIEFLVTGLSSPSFSLVIDLFSKILTINILALISASFIKRILIEQRTSQKFQNLTQTLEQKVRERTKEVQTAYEDIKKRKEDLERFYSLTVGRELKMIELKEKIKELEEKVEQ